MTIHINTRRILIGAAAVVLLTAACSAAFLAGQTSRISDADAADRTKVAVEHVQAEAQQASDQRAVAIRRYEATRLDTRVHRLNTMWRKRLRRAADKARDDGYSSGNAAGYSAGSAEGYEEGNEDGFDEGHEAGIEDGSDDLVCSDDPDVPLPYCDW